MTRRLEDDAGPGLGFPFGDSFNLIPSRPLNRDPQVGCCEPRALVFSPFTDGG